MRAGRFQSGGVKIFVTMLYSVSGELLYRESFFLYLDHITHEKFHAFFSPYIRSALLLTVNRT